MRVRDLHPWDLSPSEAREVQERLRDRVVERPLDWSRLARVAGCDVAIDRDTLHAAVVVVDGRTLEILEVADGWSRARFPYLPGLLSFREIPALLEPLGRLRRRPDALLCDGQGRSHPRRFGLACHLGLLLDLPTVGVAKSRLIGEGPDPGPRRGAWTEIHDRDEVIGRLLRTRDRVRPLYVSVGHRITLADACALVLRMGGGFRLPEPTRLADRHVGRLARGESGPTGSR